MAESEREREAAFNAAVKRTQQIFGVRMFTKIQALPAEWQDPQFVRQGGLAIVLASGTPTPYLREILAMLKMEVEQRERIEGIADLEARGAAEPPAKLTRKQQRELDRLNGKNAKTGRQARAIASMRKKLEPEAPAEPAAEPEGAAWDSNEPPADRPDLAEATS